MSNATPLITAPPTLAAVINYFGNNTAATMRFAFHLFVFVVAIVVAQTVAFSLWPQPVVAPSPEAIPQDREGFVRRFFRWLGFLRPPVLGFSAYNHIDLGDPGEFKKDFEFRIGPKPAVNFEQAEEQQYARHPLPPPSWGNNLVQ